VGGVVACGADALKKPNLGCGERYAVRRGAGMQLHGERRFVKALEHLVEPVPLLIGKRDSPQRCADRAIHFGALFVLSEVKVQRTEDGAVAATGGVCHLYDPWNLDDGILTPIGYRYQVRPDRLRVVGPADFPSLALGIQTDDG
jgi:hypothetical protein